MRINFRGIVSLRKKSLLLPLFLLFFYPASGLFGAPSEKGIADTLNLLDEVVVTGTPIQINKNQVSMSLSVVEGTILEESAESALLPALARHVPGMFITERGVSGFGVATGAAGGMTMRGIGGSPTTGVLVLIDGHPQFMGIMGHPLPDAYIASDAERVEVIRGPGSTLYGSNAMGGVINIITKKQHTDGFKTSLKAMYGSYNTQKYAASNGMRKGKFSYYLSLNHDRTDGHRDFSRFHITNGYGKFGYNISKGLSLNADVSIAKYKAEDPGKISSPAQKSQWADILRGMASASLENNFKGVSGALRLFYNFGEHKIYDGFHSNDYNYGINLYQAVNTFKGNVTTLGFDYKQYGGKANNTESFKDFVDNRVSEVAGYIFTQQTLFAHLMLNAGLRFENNSAYGNQWVPQGGIAYNFDSHTTLKASVAKGYRSPTLKELYSTNMGPSNPDLKPEQLMNYEVSAGQRLLQGRMSLELTLFLAEGDNMIKTLPVNGRPVCVNTGSFTNKGVEFALQYRVLDNLSLSGNYSFLSMNEPVLAAPEQQGFFSADYTLFKKLSFGAEVQYIDNLYTSVKPVAKETYTLLNAKISYLPHKVVEIFVRGENLTDSQYMINDGYTMPGITVMGGVNVRF